MTLFLSVSSKYYDCSFLTALNKLARGVLSFAPFIEQYILQGVLKNCYPHKLLLCMHCMNLGKHICNENRSGNTFNLFSVFYIQKIPTPRGIWKCQDKYC